jgi:hypothetical protein
MPTGHVRHDDKVWELLAKDAEKGWRAILRQARIDWLDLTPSGLEIYRLLSADLQLKILPYLGSDDEGLLVEFATDPIFRRHMSLVAAENGRWSGSVMRDVVALLGSDGTPGPEDEPQDVTRARAEDVLERTEPHTALCRLRP